MQELMRQAFLLAAREEFDLAVDDRLLNAARALEQPDGLVFKSTTQLESVSPRSVTHYLYQRDAGKLKEVWAYDELRGSYTNEPIDHAGEFSRADAVALLKAAGFSQRVPKYREQSVVPASVRQLLDQMDVVSQFSAVRQIHTEIAAEGESPELLGALSRGYANLGSLSEVHWSPAHQVFKARGLLYAERMAWRTSNSPAAVCHRFYARTLAGLHKFAHQELEASSRRWTKEQAAEMPGWVDVVEAFVKYDAPALKAATEEGDHVSLARYLNVLTRDGSRSKTYVMEACELLR